MLWTRPILEFPLPGMKLDFGGIAKEYAADRVADLLLNNGQLFLAKIKRILVTALFTGIKIRSFRCLTQQALRLDLGAKSQRLTGRPATITSDFLIRLGELSVFSELRGHFFFLQNSHSFTGEW